MEVTAMTQPKGEPVTAVEEALKERDKLAVERRAQDIGLWSTWKSSPTPDNMRPLLQRFEPVFNSKVRQWKAPNTPESAYRAELKIQAVKAFETYDPNRGTALRTHLENRLQKAKRFNTQQQNYARIPEGKSSYIGSIDTATDELREELGRDPTAIEVAELVNASIVGKKKHLTSAKVDEIQKSRVKDIISSTMLSDPSPRAISRDREVMNLLRPTLTPDQQAVFDHLFGPTATDASQSTNVIARKLGKSPSQVSRIRTEILGAFNRYRG
jgi:DNA-directed RNA polymerase specialized sigma subunit